MLTIALLLALVSARADSPQLDPLASEFVTPPSSARPHTWWHWMDGNVSEAGITLDLEAMKKAGIGGAQMFTVSENIPPGPVRFLSDEWRRLTMHAVKEANRLGIELGIHNSAGWSASGGPWIAPENAMQVIAWSEKRVRGPRALDEILPQPKAPRRYQNVPYYRDIAVFAFRTPRGPRATAVDARFLGKTGVIRKDGLEPDPPRIATRTISRMIDLTGVLRPDGRLTWYVPKGEWTILRIGHVPTGKLNHFAPPEGEGLEVDKLSREALAVHWKGMLACVISDAGDVHGKLDDVLIDSYEVGDQNWTPRFREEFRRRRGYDCLRWLPVITGLTVESTEKSERFLWDFRRTIADLYADNYYGYFAELSHRAGMKLVAEPYGNGGFDDIQSGGRADVPMGEFWAGSGASMRIPRLASSIGHVYGKPLIASEAFTTDDKRGRWLIDPSSVKALGDLAFCNGINQLVFHTWAHQPWVNLDPGMTMGPWGMQLGRTLTWWNEASAWLTYLARCQVLLQQGQFIADALYFYGESAPADLKSRDELMPALPAGYDYDGCDATVLLDRLEVKDGLLVVRGGPSYRVLVLPQSRFMTPQIARKIRDLVAAGATVTGPRPAESPSLTGYPACDEEVRRIAAEVWANVDGKSVTERSFGKGKIVWGKPLERLLIDAGIPRDFQIAGDPSSETTAYIHRRIGDADVYFVSNQRREAAQLDLEFRVSGKAPELWHPESGRIEPAPVYREEKGRTIVPVRLQSAESIFVIFRKASPGLHWSDVQVRPIAGQATVAYDVALAPDGSLAVSARERSKVIATSSSGVRTAAAIASVEEPIGLRGPWSLHFPLNWGAPRTVLLPRLMSWSDHSNQGVRYFSGTATYANDFEIPAAFLAASSQPGGGGPVVLELGRVKNLARVRLNGKELGILWKEPFAVDITNVLHAGANHLKIEVTNLWPNRIIGDEQLPPDVEWSGDHLAAWPDWLVKGRPRPKKGRFTFSTWRFYTKNSPLLESGLLGPVTIRRPALVIIAKPK